MLGWEEQRVGDKGEDPEPWAAPTHICLSSECQVQGTVVTTPPPLTLGASPAPLGVRGLSERVSVNGPAAQ